MELNKGSSKLQAMSAENKLLKESQASTSEDVSKVLSRLSEIASENELLKESYSSVAKAIMAFDDVGWDMPNGVDPSNGFNLSEIKGVSERIREMTEANPLLKRGSAMRTSYIFGRGVSFGDLQPRFRKVIDNPVNQDVLFSPEAQSINERSHFTDGQFFVTGDIRTKEFSRVPFSQITAVVTDPDDAEKIRYVRRSWTRTEQNLADGTYVSKDMNVWYPTDSYNPVGVRYATSIQKQPVDTSKRMFVSRVNRRAGRVWGVPDALPALPWAHAYNEYLKDGTRVLKSLAMFAWQLRSKTRAGGTAAAAAIATGSTVGATAVMGDGMEMSSMPRSNTVDLGTGRPLASMVASALEVSIVALLSDPGTSGSSATAQTLDIPTMKAMESRQAVWSQFYKRVLVFLGAPEVNVNWPKIEVEATQRMMQAYALAKETNAIWDDEYREAVIELLDVPKMHIGSPPIFDELQSDSSSVPSQGNSGAVGSMQTNANDQRAADDAPIA